MSVLISILGIIVILVGNIKKVKRYDLVKQRQNHTAYSFNNYFTSRIIISEGITLPCQYNSAATFAASSK